MNFFRRLFGRAAPRETDTPVHGKTSLVIHMEPDGRLSATFLLPEPTNGQEYDEYTKNIVTMLFLLNSGRLIGLLEQSLALAGDRQDVPNMSITILSQLNAALAVQNGGNRGNDLVVPPLSAFETRTEGAPN